MRHRSIFIRRSPQRDLVVVGASLMLAVLFTVIWGVLGAAALEPQFIPEPAVVYPGDFANCANGTGNNATIAIPLGTVQSHEYLDYTPVTGDKIGVFYLPLVDDLLPTRKLCVGITEYTAVSGNSITVWGDDTTGTPTERDGIPSGATMHWYILHQGTTIQSVDEVAAAEVYATNTAYLIDPTGSGSYLANGIYVLSQLQPTNEPTALALLALLATTPSTISLYGFATLTGLLAATTMLILRRSERPHR